MISELSTICWKISKVISWLVLICQQV